MIQISRKRTLYLVFPSGTTAHLHIILTDPDTDDPVKAVMVNISTYRGLKTEDSTVILTRMITRIFNMTHMWHTIMQENLMLILYKT